MRRAAIWIAFAIAFSAGPTPFVAAAELIAVEHARCAICLRFDATVARSYRRSAEGRAAPLRRVDIARRVPAYVEGIRVVPTFILRDKGREIGRFEGFTDAASFYRRVGALLARAD
mgnify:CR=1 FL=1